MNTKWQLFAQQTHQINVSLILSLQFDVILLHFVAFKFAKPITKTNEKIT